MVVGIDVINPSPSVGIVASVDAVAWGLKV